MFTRMIKRFLARYIPKSKLALIFTGSNNVLYTFRWLQFFFQCLNFYWLNFSLFLSICIHYTIKNKKNWTFDRHHIERAPGIYKIKTVKFAKEKKIKIILVLTKFSFATKVISKLRCLCHSLEMKKKRIVKFVWSEALNKTKQSGVMFRIIQ